MDNPTIESGEKFGTGGAVTQRPRFGHAREAREFWERVFVSSMQSGDHRGAEQIAEIADHALSAWELRWLASEPQPPQG